MYCIIAMKDKQHYKSIVCHGDDIATIREALRTRYIRTDSTTKLIDQGDLNHLDNYNLVSFHQDCGYGWNETRPVTHANHQLLVSYTDSIGADSLFVFDNGSWHEGRISEHRYRNIA